MYSTPFENAAFLWSTGPPQNQDTVSNTDPLAPATDSSLPFYWWLWQPGVARWGGCGSPVPPVAVAQLLPLACWCAGRLLHSNRELRCIWGESTDIARKELWLLESRIGDSKPAWPSEEWRGCWVKTANVGYVWVAKNAWKWVKPVICFDGVLWISSVIIIHCMQMDKIRIGGVPWKTFRDLMLMIDVFDRRLITEIYSSMKKTITPQTPSHLHSKASKNVSIFIRNNKKQALLVHTPHRTSIAKLTKVIAQRLQVPV